MIFLTKPTLIIQTSPLHTASTVLVNGLYGMIPELSEMNVVYYADCWDENQYDEETFEDYLVLESSNAFEDIVVVKSHHTRLSYYMGKYGDYYNVFFVSSERKEKGSPEYLFPDKYRNLDNLILFDYEEINERETYTVEDIVSCMYEKLNQTIPNIEFDIAGGVARIEGMNARYEEIKEMPFEYVDEFYRIHGSHRNRTHHIPTNPYWK